MQHMECCQGVLILWQKSCQMRGICQGLHALARCMQASANLMSNLTQATLVADLWVCVYSDIWLAANLTVHMILDHTG